MPKVTSYSISGVNPTSGDVETLVEVGYDNGNASMWGDAIESISPTDKLDKLNPVTDGNLIVGYTDAGGGSQYGTNGGTSNIIIQENPNIDAGQILAKYSYQNIVCGGSNVIGNLSSEGNHSSIYNNIIFGSSNTLGSTGKGLYDNFIFGDSNSVYGADGYGLLVGGCGNTFNANSGACLGSGNSRTSTSGYCVNIIGRGNTLTESDYDFSVVGSYNTLSCGTHILGRSNTVYSDGIGLWSSVVGEQNTLNQYLQSDIIAGSRNVIGDTTSSQDGSITVWGVIGSENAIVRRPTASESKLNTLGIDNYITAGTHNTINGSEVVVGHHNTASQMSTVIGNYNTAEGGTTVTDSSSPNYFRYSAIIVGDRNNAPYGSSNFIFGTDNTAGGGAGLIIGRNNNVSGGSSAIGENILIQYGSYALGKNISLTGGGGCTLIGNSVNTNVTANCFGNTIDVGYLKDVEVSEQYPEGKQQMYGLPGTYLGNNLKTGTADASWSSFVTVIGSYNDTEIDTGSTFVLADGKSSARHNLMYTDSSHNAHFSDSVFATNLPDAPSSAGTYTLKCVVDESGNKTYSWV